MKKVFDRKGDYGRILRCSVDLVSEVVTITENNESEIENQIPLARPSRLPTNFIIAHKEIAFLFPTGFLSRQKRRGEEKKPGIDHF
ncbi:MAG: hypothetical protein ACLQBD_06670 [Syntrophobacteraceae bacterium]